MKGKIPQDVNAGCRNIRQRRQVFSKTAAKVEKQRV